MKMPSRHSAFGWRWQGGECARLHMPRHPPLRDQRMAETQIPLLFQQENLISVLIIYVI
jgi:hypothetical protein